LRPNQPKRKRYFCICFSVSAAVIGGQKLKLLQAALIFRLGDLARRAGSPECRQPRRLACSLFIAHLGTCCRQFAFDDRIDIGRE
jgi:hypothetical protein